MFIWFYDVCITFFSCRWQWVLQYEEKASQAKEVEEGLLEEEEVAGVTLVNLMGVAAVVAAVVAIGKPRVEFGMMAMTSVSSAKQGALPGHYALWMFKYETVSFPNLWDNRWYRERGENDNSGHVNCSYFKTFHSSSL